MKKLQAYGLITALIGVTYAAYWFVTYHQMLEIEQIPAGNISNEQFVQTYPNLVWAFRFFDFRPFDEDYSPRAISPVQFIPKHMLRHGWSGIALLCLGIGIATFPATTTFQRVVHYAVILLLGASLVIIAIFHPIVWFWNCK